MCTTHDQASTLGAYRDTGAPRPRQRFDGPFCGASPADATAALQPVAPGADPAVVPADRAAAVDAGHLARDRGRNQPLPAGAATRDPAIRELLAGLGIRAVRALLPQQR